MIDPALLRPGRLDKLLLCDYPSSEERRTILQQHLARLQSQLKVVFPETLQDILVERSEGVSGADLIGLLKRVIDAARGDLSYLIEVLWSSLSRR